MLVNTNIPAIFHLQKSLVRRGQNQCWIATKHMQINCTLCRRYIQTMWLGILILQFCVLGMVCQLNVIRLTSKLQRQGFYKDLELGDVISEAVVDSPGKCGALCQQNPACHTVMMMGQLCRLFAEKQCPVRYNRNGQ